MSLSPKNKQSYPEQRALLEETQSILYTLPQKEKCKHEIINENDFIGSYFRIKTLIIKTKKI